MSIVIIGNGIAGNSALRAVRAIDKRVKVIVVSEEKDLLYSACVLPDYLAGELPRREVFLESPEDYAGLNAELKFGRVTAIDPGRREIILENGRLSYRRLILATGSEPVIPPVPGKELPGNFALKTLADADSILGYPASRWVIVGSGPVGVEASAALARRGCRVTLVEKLDWILPKVFDQYPAGVIREGLAGLGVAVRTGTGVKAVQGRNAVEKLTLDSGEVIPCDAVIWAAGVRPRVELARQAGLAIGGTGGIVTDSRMQTSHPGVFAGGDCAETADAAGNGPVLSLLWHSAAHQGMVAGANCLGAGKEYPGSTAQVVIELPGLVAGAVGYPAAVMGAGVTASEWSGRNQYHRLVFSGGRVAGCQSINNLNYLGGVQNNIRKRAGIDTWRNREFARLIPWAGGLLVPYAAGHKNVELQ
ncbi:MAG: NAD(P)/FAD-dependent oxidoreductase [Bacillota bacterium]